MLACLLAYLLETRMLACLLAYLQAAVGNHKGEPKHPWLTTQPVAARSAGTLCEAIAAGALYFMLSCSSN